jgi:hypothetical protein
MTLVGAFRIDRDAEMTFKIPSKAGSERSSVSASACRHGLVIVIGGCKIAARWNLPHSSR